MSRVFISLMLVLGVLACRTVSFKEVQLPTEGPTYVVECNYEFDNCRKYAEAHCPEARFEEITRKNCPACGKQVPAYPQRNAPFQMSKYRGTLYYRCL